MFSTESTLASNVTPPVSGSEQLVLYNYKSPGTFAAGDYLVALAISATAYDEFGTGIVTYSDETGTLSAATTGLDGDFEYNKTRTGWVALEIDSEYFRVQVKEYRSTGYIDFNANESTNILQVLQISAGKFADYEFVDTTLFVRDNIVSTNIEFLNYAETDTNDIEIGFDGTLVTASYTVGSNDVNNLDGDDMIITLTIRLNNSGGSLLFSGSDQRGDTGLISVSDSITSTDIGSEERIWIKVELSTKSPL